MSLHAILSDGGCDALFRQHAVTAPEALRDAICYVEHYGDTPVTARSQAEAESAALTHWQIEGDMRRKVKATFVRWCKP